MASLKEIRARIASVSSTQKLTSAMKMVSAAKLHKSEEATLKFVPYKNKLSDMLSQYLSSVDTEKVNITLAEKREVKRVAIICISSCTGLCGTFNSNINKLLEKTLKEYSNLPEQDILIYPIGKKISDYVRKTNRIAQCSIDDLSAKPTYDDAINFISPLVEKFQNKEIDKIVLLYNHHKNAGVQIPTSETYLPLETIETKSNNKSYLYFTEPDIDTFINTLVPMVVRMKFYAAVIDSNTAEHGARTTAMQIASDNANKMLETITQQYNRARQEVITNELLDIVGGAEALRN
jgi:F-type H+-transporting ATPase subunit gamma